MVLAMQIRRIHHVTLAVHDAAAARATFARLFGTPGDEGRDVPLFGIRAATLRLGEDELELASPSSPDNPVARFLARKGEGFYSIALEVDDIAAAVAELRESGVQASDPVEAEPGIRSAFVAMAATHGLSIQLVEVAGAVRMGAAPPAEESGSAVAPAVEPGTPDQAPARPVPLDLTPDEWSDVD